MSEEKINEFLDGLSLSELGDVIRASLATLYNKLRSEENFGYNQAGLVTSLGEHEYDVGLMIVDLDRASSGLDWPQCYNI